MWPKGFRIMVSGLLGATRGRGWGGREGGTGAFDIHTVAGAGCGPLPGGTNQICRHHRKLIHRLSREPRVLGSNL